MSSKINSPTRIELTDEQRRLLRVGDVVVVRWPEGTEEASNVRETPREYLPGQWVVALGLRGYSCTVNVSRIVAILSTPHSAGPVARCERCWWPLKATTAEV